MSRTALLLTLATLTSVTAVAQTAAPIERNYPQDARRYHSAPKTTTPAPGITITSEGKVETVATDADHTELRLSAGRATLSIDHPEDNALILVDLPNGQADLLKDGQYSLNASTNTLTVLHGEADVFAPGAPSNAKGITVKEGESIVLGADKRSHEATHAEYAAAFIPGISAPAGYARNPGGYGEGFVAEPGFAAPGYAYYDGWDYPYAGYGWGNPYGWGPGFGVGIGFGGFYGGGYRGGFGGFHGGGFRR